MRHGSGLSDETCRRGPGVAHDERSTAKAATMHGSRFLFMVDGSNSPKSVFDAIDFSFRIESAFKKDSPPQLRLVPQNSLSVTRKSCRSTQTLRSVSKSRNCGDEGSLVRRQCLEESGAVVPKDPANDGCTHRKAAAPCGTTAHPIQYATAKMKTRAKNAGAIRLLAPALTSCEQTEPNE
jgi:hypothetical protein